jgi:hypothetical protein
VGVLTGMRPGAFSISLDQRQSGTPIENLLMVHSSAWLCAMMAHGLSTLALFGW